MISTHVIVYSTTVVFGVNATMYVSSMLLRYGIEWLPTVTGVTAYSLRSSCSVRDANSGVRA